MHLGKPCFKYTNSGAMVHRQLVYIYLLNVPSFSSRYFNKIKTNVAFREIARLIARNSFYPRIKCQMSVFGRHERLIFQACKSSK